MARAAQSLNGVGRTPLSRDMAAMSALYARFYGHERTTATTYINDDVVVCILVDILSADEARLVSEGAAAQVMDGRIAFQIGYEYH